MEHKVTTSREMGTATCSKQNKNHNQHQAYSPLRNYRTLSYSIIAEAPISLHEFAGLQLLTMHLVLE